MLKKNNDAAMQLVSGIDTKELGGELLKAAQESFRADTQKVVVDGIKGIIADVERSNKAIAEHTARIDKQNRRIDALKAGKFKITMGGYDTGGAPRVEFDDEDLRGL